MGTPGIGGGQAPPADGRYFPTANPATGEAVALVADGDAADVDRAAQVAQQALAGWSAMAPLGGALPNAACIAQLIREDLDELDRLERVPHMQS